MTGVQLEDYRSDWCSAGVGSPCQCCIYLVSVHSNLGIEQQYRESRHDSFRNNSRSRDLPGSNSSRIFPDPF